MTTIHVNNSECQVINATPREEKLLRSNLRYRDESVNYSYQKNLREIKKLNTVLNSRSFNFSNSHLEKELARLLHINRGIERKLFIDLYKDGKFPTGLLPRALSLLGADVEVVDKRIKPKLKTNKFILKESLPPLRYYQKASAKALEESERGIVVLPTGTGKSLLMCRMIWDLGVNTLIITPSKAITDMMLEVTIRHFGKGKVEKLTTKTEKITKPIAICNIQALIKIKPSVMKDIDAVFVDEFHHSSAETYREVNLKHLKNVYFRLGLTATNFRNDGSDIALESVLSKVLYEYEVKQAIKDGFLVQPDFEIIDNTNEPHAKTYQSEYKKGIVENNNRNKLIAEMAHHYRKNHVIILVQQVAHGRTLSELLPNASFIHGQEKDSKRQKIMENFKSGKLNCLIGTSVIGEGVDLPCADVLIIAGGGKARSQIMQAVGRVLRIHPNKTKALVIDFQDSGSRWLSEHSKLRQQVYEIYGI